MNYFIWIRRSPPKWLKQNEILKQFTHQSNESNQYTRHQSFVEQGVDEELAQFYGKKNMMSILGSDNFREWTYSVKSEDEEITRKSRHFLNLPTEIIIAMVAKEFDVKQEAITKATRGRGQKNIPIL